LSQLNNKAGEVKKNLPLYFAIAHYSSVIYKSGGYPETSAK
jgi:hypothetical protein